MRIVPNTGTDRVVDLVRPWLQASHRIDLASEALSLFAFGELAGNLARTTGVRLVLPPDNTELDLLGSAAERAARNRLLGRWLAGRFAAWIEKTAEVRRANGAVPQGAVVLRDGDGCPRQALLGSFSFSTDGLGLAPGNPLNLIQASETPEECERRGAWFDAQRSRLNQDDAAKADLVAALRRLAADRDPSGIYALILHHLFQTEGDELDEERVIKSATGIRDTEVWKRLFKFQRDPGLFTKADERTRVVLLTHCPIYSNGGSLGALGRDAMGESSIDRFCREYALAGPGSAQGRLPGGPLAEAR